MATILRFPSKDEPRDRGNVGCRETKQALVIEQSREPVLKPGHRYANGEITADGQHRFCRWCDIFWGLNHECYHQAQDRARLERR